MKKTRRKAASFAILLAMLITSVLPASGSIAESTDETPAPAVAVETVSPSVSPAVEPTAEPAEEVSTEQTEEPNIEPTEEPTVEPTEEPSVEPTEEPTLEPTEEPSVEPTEEPTPEPETMAMDAVSRAPVQIDTITGVVLTKLDGTIIDGTNSSGVSIDDKVRVEYAWAITETQRGNMIAGDYTVVNLPSELRIYNTINGNLYMDTNNTVIVGTYVITTSGVLTMTFNQNAVDYFDVAGTVWAQTWFDESLFGDENPAEILFPINSTETTTVTVKFSPQGVTESVTESGTTDKDYNAKTITWTVYVNRKLESLTNVTVVDTLGAGQTMDETSVRLYNLTMTPAGGQRSGQRDYLRRVCPFHQRRAGFPWRWATSTPPTALYTPPPSQTKARPC